MKKLLMFAVAGAVVGAFVCMPSGASAAQFKAASNVTVSSAAEGENVYGVGQNVNSTAALGGDLLAAGEVVLVNGSVAGDAMLLGKQVTVNAPVTGDVRAAGSEVTIGAAIGGELIAVGQNVTVVGGATTSGDVYLAGASVNFSGNAAGKLVVRGGDVYIDGTVAKDTVIKASRSLEFGPHAVLEGATHYNAPQEAKIDPDTKFVGERTFEKLAPRSDNEKAHTSWLAGFVTFWLIMKLLSWWVLALIMLAVWRKPVMRMQHDLRQNFWPRVLYGLCMLVAVPIVSIAIMFTVVGILPALVALMVYGALLLVAGVFLAITSAALLNEFVFRKRFDTLPFWLLLVGALVACLVSAVPLLGGLAVFIAFLAGFGVLSRDLVGFIKPAGKQ